MKAEFSEITALFERSDFKSFYEEALLMLYRVLLARDELIRRNESELSDSDIFYKTMLSATQELDIRFPGDADYFYVFFQLLRDINDEEILELFSYLRERCFLTHITLPACVQTEYIKRIKKKAGQNILIAEYDKWGNEMYEFLRNNINMNFDLTCCFRSSELVLKYVFRNVSHVVFIDADIYRRLPDMDRYDYILAAPDFGRKAFTEENSNFLARDADLMATENLLSLLANGGRLIILLPAKITFGGAGTACLRQFILKEYGLEEIAVFPAETLNARTNIIICLFTFCRGKTEQITLRQYQGQYSQNRSRGLVRARKQFKEISLEKEVFVSSKEFHALKTWNYNAYLCENHVSPEMLYFHSYAEKRKLEDVAELFRGKVISSRTKDEGEIRVINISNITDSGIEYNSLDRLNDSPAKNKQYILEDEDVLVTSRGTTLKIAVFQKQDFDCIPASNFNVIRTNSQLLRGPWLKLFFETEVGRLLLEGIQRGVFLANINCQDMGELEIPVPPLTRQDEIVQRYEKGFQEYRQLVVSTKEKWDKLFVAIQKELY
ncbi:MAG: restriction endonuclease subunit S [Thermoguttaceae bacterium]|nr:restriction endonuclease subunit S [Thermoguttaceae bacterium]